MIKLAGALVMDIDAKDFHIPVMKKEVLDSLNLKPNSCMVDCTVGLGGHLFSIAQQMGPTVRLIGIDRDAQSLEIAKEKLSPFTSQLELIHGDFRNIDKILRKIGIAKVDGMLFDLGISSFQLNNPERGFSFKSPGPLDMRIDQNSLISAYELVNSLSQQEISMILRNYGEERWHNRIARLLVMQRAVKPLESTKDLNDIILKAIPSQMKWQKTHPATRTFQAIRIAVNQELEAISTALDKSMDLLAPAARICVISFHSLEDRIVKNAFRNFARDGKLKLIVKKPLRPQLQEVTENPRSRSARLRVAERVS